jgi:DNA repair photolyase
MGLNKSKGNMYDWVTHTWNTVKGQCYHDCVYCYMKTWGEQPKIRFDEKELKTDLGRGNIIFVGNTNDMFASNIPDEWIDLTIGKCNIHENQYVFQSKDPRRMAAFLHQMPANIILGTTIETNRDIKPFSKAPSTKYRAEWIGELTKTEKTFITIEPIIDFDLMPFAKMIIEARPDFVNIGADSKNHRLPEPDFMKVAELIDELKHEGIEIRKKKNLERLLTN